MAWTDKFVNADATGTADGSSEANGWTTWAAAVTGVGAGPASVPTRINVKRPASGGYAQGATALTLNTAGATTAPVWWRGYNATPGDIDANNALAKPTVTFTTANMVVSGAFQILSNLDISGSYVALSSGQLSITGGSVWVHRCRVANAGAGANGRAVNATSGAADCLLSAGQFVSPTAATFAVVLSGARSGIVGSAVRGGVAGLSLANIGQYALFNAIDDPGAGAGIEVSSTAVVACNSISGAGTDAVRVTAANLTVLVFNNVSASSGAYAVNQSAGTVSAAVRVLANAFHSAGTAELNGITESLSFLGSGLLAVNPFANAAGHDFALDPGAKALGFPGGFENEAYIGYLDPGAVQRQEPAGGGGGGPVPGFGSPFIRGT